MTRNSSFSQRVLATKTTVTPNVFTPWSGLIQRMVIIPYLAWIFTFAAALQKQ